MDPINKKLLFLGIGFYDYEKVISSELVNKGYDVTYINLIVANIISRLLTRLKWKSLLDYYKHKAIVNLIRNSPKDNSIVFIIKGSNLNKDIIDFLKSRNPKAKYILYFWDSLVRIENARILLDNFDNIYSFDRQDCLSFPNIKFRPLFYREVPNSALIKKQYYISFIGWCHSDRLKFLRDIASKLQEKKLPFYFKLYIGHYNYLFLRFFKKELLKTDMNYLTLSTIPYAQVIDVIAKSRSVLDIAHPRQSGLTIRTLESLAAGCYLYTTNEDIKSYKQISIESFSIINRNISDSIPLIYKSPRQSRDFYKYFSLNTFLNEMFKFDEY